MLIRSITIPVSRLQRAVVTLAEGDLRQRIQSRSNDELGQLSRGFDEMVQKVRGMLGQTRDIASSMMDSSLSFQQSAGVTASANEDIVVSISEISTGAESQSVLAEQNAKLIGDLENELC